MVVSKFSSCKVSKKNLIAFLGVSTEASKRLHIIDFSLETIATIEMSYFDSNLML